MRHIIIALVMGGTIAAPAAAQQSRGTHTGRAPAVASSHLNAPHTPSHGTFAVASAGAAEAAIPTLPRAAWAPQDPADSVWRAAREALNRGEHARAAQLYNQIRTASRFNRSEYRVPSYYWEAYAREKLGTVGELRTALSVLARLKREHPNYEGMAEARRLESSINTQLARQGNSDAQTNVNETVNNIAQNQQCDETQMYALEALIHMPAAEAVPILKRVLERRGCDKMREQALFILSQKRSPETEEILFNAIRNDPSPAVRQTAVFWLSQVNSDRAVDALDNIIRTATDKKLLENAVFALSQSRNARAGELLRELVTRSNVPADVRKNAIFFLAQRRDPNIGPLMRSLYAQATDTETKNAILFALSQRREEESGKFLFDIALNEREDIEVRKQALFWAGQQRALPVARLSELYRTMPNVELKKQVLFTLTQTRDPEAITQLIEIARTERNPELRKDAIIWLGQSRDPRAARFLAEIIGG